MIGPAKCWCDKGISVPHPHHPEYAELACPDVPAAPTWEDIERENALLLEVDAAIYGVNYVDVTGKHIDPRSIG